MSTLRTRSATGAGLTAAAGAAAAAGTAAKAERSAKGSSNRRIRILRVSYRGHHSGAPAPRNGPACAILEATRTKEMPPVQHVVETAEASPQRHLCCIIATPYLPG